MTMPVVMVTNSTLFQSQKSTYDIIWETTDKLARDLNNYTLCSLLEGL